MPRVTKYPEHILVRFPANTKDRIDAAKKPDEDRTDYIRRAVEAMLKKDERAEEKPKRKRK